MQDMESYTPLTQGTNHYVNQDEDQHSDELGELPDLEPSQITEVTSVSQSKTEELVDEHGEFLNSLALHHFTEGHNFQAATAVVIAINTILIGAESVFIQQPRVRTVAEHIEAVFTVFYACELALRLWDRGLHKFFFGHGHAWNLFDFLVTILTVCDAILTMYDASQNSSATSVCRLFRIMRILRMFRAMKFAHEVEEVVTTAAKATVKLAILVALVVYVAATVVTNLLYDSDDPEVAEQFSNLFVSMWSMFVLMTLDNWGSNSAQVIAGCSSMRFFYVIFVFIGSIALMTLVPGVFIEYNLTAHEREKELQANRSKNQTRRNDRRMLKRIFSYMDKDRTGYTSYRKLRSLTDHDQAARLIAKDHEFPKSDLLDIKYGIFDLLYHLWEEDPDTDAPLSKDDFLDRALAPRMEGNPHLWRSVMNCGIRVHKLDDLVRAELSNIEEVNVASNHKMDEVLEQICSIRDCMQEEMRSLREMVSFIRNSAPAQVSAATVEDIAQRTSVHVRQLLADSFDHFPKNAWAPGSATCFTEPRIMGSSPSQDQWTRLEDAAANAKRANSEAPSRRNYWTYAMEQLKLESQQSQSSAHKQTSGPESNLLPTERSSNALGVCHNTANHIGQQHCGPRKGVDELRHSARSVAKPKLDLHQAPSQRTLKPDRVSSQERLTARGTHLKRRWSRPRSFERSRRGDDAQEHK